MKSIVQAGRDHSGLFEKRLCELRELSLDYRDKLNDMHKLHYLREDYDIKAHLSDGVVDYQPNTLYVSQEKLEQCFSEDKRHLKPILAMLSGIDMARLTSFVQNFGFHKVEEGDISHFGMPFAYLHLTS